MNASLSNKNSDSAQSADNRLIAAIYADDHAAFYAELEKITNVNARGGIFLQCAAETRNSLLMRELVMAGADINYAHDNAYREMQPIKFEREKPFVADKKIFSTPEDKSKYERLSKITEQLHYFKKTFVEMIVPTEIARHQKTLMQEMQEMRRELTELRESRPIEKKNLKPASSINSR
ncbi:MAG: hypothetical protein ACK4PK_02470 [Alphaproteobacteria bacterium]